MNETVLGFPPAILAAFITFIGAVIFAPIATRVLTQLFEKKSRLSVSIYASDIGPSTFLKKHLNYGFDTELTKEERDQRDIFRRLKGYVAVKISNNGSSVVKSVTLSAPDDGLFEFVAQVGDSEETTVISKGKQVLVGDIQPKRSALIHCHTHFTVADYQSKFLVDKFHVTADQVDKVSYSFDIPNYLSSSYSFRKKPKIPISMMIVILLTIAQIGYGIYQVVKTKI